MKRIILILILMSFCTLSAFASKYKVNSSGIVTNSAGQVTNTKNDNIPAGDVYKNYYAQTYVNNKYAASNNINTINIVMDYSASMAYWVGAARKCMSSIIKQLPQDTKIGLRVFGQNKPGDSYNNVLSKVKDVVRKEDGKYSVKASLPSYLGNISGVCGATSQIVEITNYNRDALIDGMYSVNIQGATPLTYALSMAVQNDFARMDRTTPKKIILITDGEESCGGDPCAFAYELMQTRKDIVIDVVLVSFFSKRIKCVADITGGKFYNPGDISGFMNVLNQSMTEPVGKGSQEEKQQQQYEYINN